MFKYILFDFDGTVFDTVEGITKSVRYAINRRGMDAELEALRCFFIFIQICRPIDLHMLSRQGSLRNQLFLILK